MKLSGFAFLLFLTLLSCNSAEDEAAIKNSIDAEAQLQKMNVTLFDNGNGYTYHIQGEYVTTPKNQEMSSKRSTLFSLMEQINEIDSLTANNIHFLDQLKISLLKAAGENYSIKTEQIVLPNHFDFSNLKNADSDIASEQIINSNEMNMFNRFKIYRNELVKIVAETEDKKLSVKDINDYKDETDLEKKVIAQISSKVPNPRDDKQAVTDLYMLLTLPNNLIVNGQKQPWMQAIFQQSNLIGAITQLTILQNKILQARSYALAHISSRISICGYGFDKIIPFAQGPSIVNEGETAEITIGIAAFDSYNQPEVTLQSFDGEILKPENGTGKVRVKLKEGLQKVSGTVSIKNKSGVKKTENWEWDIHVLPKK